MAWSALPTEIKIRRVEVFPGEDADHPQISVVAERLVDGLPVTRHVGPAEIMSGTLSEWEDMRVALVAALPEPA